MIDFKILNKEGLEKFINSDEYFRLKTLPITKHRAISHIKNPRADKDDILLILVYTENDIVGYLGVLPDRLFLSNEKSYKCGWLSCFWVDSSVRGKGIGEQLIRKALMLWDNKILSTEFVPLTKKIYNKTGAFGSPLIKSGIRLYIRMNLQTILPPKKRIFQKIKAFLKVIDAFLNSLLDLRFLFCKNKLPPVKLEYVNHLDNETGKFISRFQDRALFKRGINELNWIIDYPWILSKPTKDFDSQRYYFSSVDKSFDFYCLKVRNNLDELVAFLILTKRNRILKLPYCYMEKGALTHVIKIIDIHILNWRIDTFSTFHPELVKYLSTKKTISIYKKKIERQYLISNVLNNIIKENKYNIQDGDADCAFT
ncbi:MAG: GNAT family N-acetyltransferase [Bacteroidales bacterium]|jgi:GNAT superfamily N-acetyltransferase|nr:GNAT family N-acetyltransferase [Bacteroidales bacterium]